MEDQQRTSTDTTTQSEQPGKEQEPGSVTRELQELGRQLSATARTAWQSERRQELQQEVTEGLRSVSDQLTETIDSVRAHPRTQNVTHTVKEGVDKVAGTTRTTRAGDLVDDVRTGLASGLRELTDQLRRLTERLERQERDERDTGEAAFPDVSPTAPVVTDMPSAVQVAPPAVTPETAHPGSAGAPGEAAGYDFGATAGAETGGVAGMGQGPRRDLPSAPEGGEGSVDLDDREKRGEVPTA